jgi:hypothetical protein
MQPVFHTFGRYRNPLFALALLGLCVIPACNSRDPNLPEVAYVEGTVMFQGKPLPEGVVRFIPEDTKANPANGMIMEDGTFQLSTYERLDGAAVGKHKVTIEIPPHLDGSDPDPPIQLPKQYASLANTPLSVEVVGGKTNTFELVIEE